MAWPKGLDIRALNVFTETARSGNMAEAARLLGMTQPAVSQYISKIEEALGTQLLDRRLRPARLTPAGEVLRDRAEALISSAELAMAAVRNVGEQPLAELRIAVPNSIAATLTPWLYEHVHRDMRPGNFSLRAGQAFDRVRALIEREVDLIITSEVAEHIAGVEQFELFREGTVLMLPPNYKGTPSSLQELLDELPLIRFTGHNVVGQLVERHLRRLRLSPPRVAEFDTAQSVSAMVSAGHGFAIATPMCVLEGASVGHDVRACAMPGPSVSRTLYLLARSRELGSQAEMFASICRRVLHENVAPMVADRMPWLADGFQVLEDISMNNGEK
ncbi:LysR family transcriptional regulator [Rhodospirillales bacterium]|nr:LysR family transcriptional regulator [Rhodospirillales bacterium]